MSYKLRNSVALGLLLLLVIGIGGYIAFILQPGKINKYRKEAKAIENQLKDNTVQTSAIMSMQEKLRETTHRWNNRTKEISEKDVSSQTYGYLSDIIDESGSLKLNMSYTGTKNGTKYGYNTYKLTGSGEFPNIFRFIWLLENGRRLYKITAVTVHAEEEPATKTETPTVSLKYEMELNSFFTSESALSKPVMRPDSVPQPITSNPFFPSIQKLTPPNVRDLLDVSTINVKAVAPGKALVMDPRGKLITLQVGDEVYLGKVTATHPQEGVVDFTLNNGGIIQTVSKQIAFEKKSRGINP
ncbi:MAG TPA: hypothetical protein VMG34_15925 [Bacteroidota bacterium]|nr:hypothetical protein [Bacteroidota bacterium]